MNFQNSSDIQYIGQKKALDIIQTALTDPRDSAMLNIMGTYGSGRSALLSYIERQLTTKRWPMPQSMEPIVINIQGMSFSKDDSFISFLSRNMAKQLANQTEWEVPPGLELVEYLDQVSSRDIPIVIMIDNFSRIMERLHESEAQELNRLRPQGVHYILVTDYRSLDEISKPVYEASEFFKDAKPVRLTLLSRDESATLIELVYNSYDLSTHPPFTSAQFNDLLDLTEGFPGLLQSATRAFCFELNHLQNEPKASIDGILTWNTFLKHLLDDDQVKYYLGKIVSVVRDELSVPEQYYLLEVASNTTEIQNRLPGLDKKFAKMWLTTDGIIVNKLVQFMLLAEVIPLNLSTPERKVFDLLDSARPGVLTFDEIYENVASYSKTKSKGKKQKSTERQLVQSIVSRIRKKIAELPNSAAFQISSYRGLGYIVSSEITLDKFIGVGPSIFQDNQIEGFKPE